MPRAPSEGRAPRPDAPQVFKDRKRGSAKAKRKRRPPPQAVVHLCDGTDWQRGLCGAARRLGHVLVSGTPEERLHPWVCADCLGRRLG